MKWLPRWRCRRRRRRSRSRSSPAWPSSHRWRRPRRGMSGVQGAGVEVTGRRLAQPIPETMQVLVRSRLQVSMARISPFMTMPWPQPGHQMCGSFPGRIDFHNRKPLHDLLDFGSNLARVDRARVDAEFTDDGTTPFGGALDFIDHLARFISETTIALHCLASSLVRFSGNGQRVIGRNRPALIPSLRSSLTRSEPSGRSNRRPRPILRHRRSGTPRCSRWRRRCP